MGLKSEHSNMTRTFLPRIFLKFCILYAITLRTEGSKAIKDGGSSQKQLYGGILHKLETLSYWANKEEDVYQALSTQLALLNKEVDLISKFIKDYESSSLKAIQISNARGKLIGSSAILTHLMTHRYARITHKIRDLLQSEESQKSKDRTSKVLHIKGRGTFMHMPWPGSADLHVSHLAFQTIQKTYNFQPQQFHEGLKIETNFGGKLKSWHCVHLGVFALKMGFFAGAIEWLELASEVSGKSKSLQTLLEFAVNEHNNFHLKDDFSQDTFTRPTYLGEQKETRLSNHEHNLKKGGNFGNNSDPEGNMILLCRGAHFQPKEILSKMKCFYKKDHPYLILSPLMAEQLSDFPFILLIHDVLGEGLLKQFYETRRSEFLQSQPSLDGLPARSFTGHSKDGRFQEKMNRKSDLILKAAGNRESGMEDLQTVEYIYGKLIAPHRDPLPYIAGWDDEDETEDIFKGSRGRLATILYYIDVPAFGGATPFCEAGIAVAPKKGSAVLWFNLYRNGSVRRDVNHGSCPIIHGRKIILNQWIQYYAHFEDYKCSLDQME